MVAPPRQGSRTGNPFAQVKELGPHGAEAAEALGHAYQTLKDRGATGDAQRLLAVEAAAERRDFPALERSVAAGQPLTELSEIEHAKVRRVVGWRNAAALVPLLLTWLFLGWASYRYQEQLDADPKLSTEPFLVLWQERFGGHFIPTFAETALLAFLMLIVVLLLTMRAHQVETRADRAVNAVSSVVDGAMESLALAVQTSTVRPPATAREWAEAAQRVLTETQAMISTSTKQTQEVLEVAVTQTRELAEQNNRIAATAQRAVAELHTQGRDLIATVAQELQGTVTAVREANAQFIQRTTADATAVLRQATEANQSLIREQLTPLFQGFRDSLDDYRTDQGAYRASTDKLAHGVTELTAAASVLAGSSKSYTEIAASIDEHLRLVVTSQNDFVNRVTANAQSMAEASTTMREVAGMIGGDLRDDLAKLARNVVEASSKLEAADRQLAATSAAIASTTTALQAAARSISAANTRRATPIPTAAPPVPTQRGVFGRIFGGN
jgi:hypothetical protein